MKAQDMIRCIVIVHIFFLNCFFKLINKIIIRLYYYILYINTTSYHTSSPTSYHIQNKINKRRDYNNLLSNFSFLTDMYKNTTFYHTSYHIQEGFKTRKCQAIIS